MECSGQPTHVSKKRKKSCKNLFELELRTAVTEQLHTNQTADIHSTVSYQPTKPTTQRDHLGLQILRKKTQTRPKRDPNEAQTTQHARTHPTPTAQLPTPQPKIPPHAPKPNRTTIAKMLHFRLESYLTCEPV